MLYALNKETSEKISAMKGVEAICPMCYYPVIPKMGSVVIHHWAHQKDSDCHYGVGETQWHLEWKSKFPKENCEVRMTNHRADVFIKDIVLEFQTITPDYSKIKDREEFYNDMYWIYKYHDRKILIRKYYRDTKFSPKEYFNSYDIVQFNKVGFDQQYEYLYKDLFEQRITIYHPPKGWLNATKPIFLDLGYPEYCTNFKWYKGMDGYLYYVRWHSDNFKELFGFFISYTDFMNKFL